jgi:hypothetical protein
VRHLLLRLANNPERVLGLLGYCVERFDEIKPGAKGIGGGTPQAGT